MNTKMNTVVSLVRAIWSHVSVFTIVALLFVAGFIGYTMGSRSPLDTAPNHPSHEQDHSQEASPQLYTCSMHPAIRLENEDAKCPICFMALIPISSSDQNNNPTQLSLSESALALSHIETTKVAQFYPTASVRLYGKLAYDETQIARLSAYFPGRVERLFTNYVGVPVQKGDHIAEVYSPELLTAFEELRLASASANQFDHETSEYLITTSNQILKASRDKLRLLGISEERIAQVETSTSDLEAFTIYSPISGVVINLDIKEGDYIKTGNPLATVADLSRLWLNIQAYESQLSLLRWGMPVSFTVESQPGKTFDGHIAFIDPVVNEQSRTITVRVAVDNADHLLKPGMFTTALVHAKITDHGVLQPSHLAGKWVSPMHPTIVKDSPGSCDICGMDLVKAETLGIIDSDSNEDHEPLVIPQTAVLFTGTRSVVYVRVQNTDQPTFEARAVVLGPRAGVFYTVRAGLTLDDEVVSSGAFRIDSAMQIQAKPSMMNPSGESSLSTQHHGKATSHSSTTAQLPVHFSQSLMRIYDAYFQVQESLADDDFDRYMQASEILTDTIKSVNSSGLFHNTLNTWRSIEIILRRDDGASTIEEARVSFHHLSKAIINLQEEFGHTMQTDLHLAFCPMAFDFEGAQWLQRGTLINNPYFGASMLRCGEVLQTLSASPSQGGDKND